VWERAIKIALGRLRVPGDIGEATKAGGFLELPVFFRHIAALNVLPDRHREPIDRLLVAQAVVDDLPCLWTGI